MEFRQLEVFVTVAETKSFSKAADYLYLTQSTVSSHIKNLEKEIKKKLFIRSTKSLKLTREGASFLWYARRIIETRDAALENINSTTKHILHLGASTIPSGYLLPKLLAGFRKKYPHICFDIKQGDSTDIQEKIIDGTIELGLVGKKSEAAQCAFDYNSVCNYAGSERPAYDFHLAYIFGTAYMNGNGVVGTAHFLYVFGQCAAAFQVFFSHLEAQQDFARDFVFDFNQ